jgi:N-acetylmuramoyl-L-alanine amidase
MPSRAGWLLILSGGVAAATLAWSVRCTPRRAELSSPRPTPSSALDPRRWPGAEARLTRPAASFTAGSGVVRVMIDPGHGAVGNRGNTSSLCVDEQDAMLDLAAALAERLTATGHVEARLARDPGALVEYGERLDAAEAWGADAFISLHSDVRGHLGRWSPTPGSDCPIALEAPGFAVLYSDEGAPALTARRLALGRAVARRMSEAGLPPYGGADYTGIYAPDGDERGVFVDRHAADQRIFVLRRAAMPSILIETHNAVDPREATRWRDAETIDAFAAAVAAALGDALPATPRPGGT